GSNDRLFSGAGNDTLNASVGKGGNRLYGGLGDDLFFSGNNDRLIGGNGNDQFFFPNGSANSTATGGAGADRFQVKDPDLRLGTNTITDFTSGEDTIAIAGVEANFGDVVFTSIDEGTLISLNGEDLAILLGVKANSLNEGDLTFA
ncbi:MAG: calcium-binding protein, partial [Halothece sp. Uz-M2-17]|nr:calcium-binding protein [Halothece sp. Uz-M2-17]